ncbi:MAG TPA: MFS transporter [Candidatus Copromorpha excrementigallinarum]|uniref:MFS transporter n=1 Tax=Candidatus Allocopromorpha excrementigallinarum TaxID=2840742 RepID=A0A9D1HZX4_9FIRM|nr:MFS transporter [Candidatus Copromorpha excrementigallinarum]
MSDNSAGGKKAVDMLGYTPEQYKLFTKNAWIVLLAFSILYCFLYLGRQNISYVMPAMMEQEGWTELDLGILSSVLFWTYGIGHLFNGRLGEIFGVNRFIVVGMFLSAIANFIIGFQSSLVIIAVLWGFNGYFQSMLWSPGMALLSNWWPGKRRGFATGFANGCSGLGQVFAALAVSLSFVLLPDLGWGAGFIFPACVMVVLAIIYIFVGKESPKKIGLKDYVDSDAERNEQDEELKQMVAEKGKLFPYIYLLKMWRFDLWLLIIAGSSIARYGLLTWVPTYYTQEFGVDIEAGILGTVMLPLGMAIGAFVIPWISDKYFSKNRLPMVIICAAVAGATVFFFMFVGPGIGAQCLLFIAGFFIYAINSLVWAYATDVGGRAFAGTATGVLDCFAYLGASVQAIFFGSVLTNSGNWTLVFTAVAGVCIAIIVIAIIAGWGLNKKPEKN